MKTIHKYQITPGDRLKIHLPEGAKVISVGSQLVGLVHFWVEIDLAEEQTHVRTFELHGTGAAIPDHHSYLGSVQDPPDVWHLYERFLPNTDAELEAQEQRDEAEDKREDIFETAAETAAEASALA